MGILNYYIVKVFLTGKILRSVNFLVSNDKFRKNDYKVEELMLFSEHY